MSDQIVLSKNERRSRDEAMQVLDLPIREILDNPFQPRKRYPQKYIKLLAKSISERGLLHPISVVRVKDDANHYVVVGGHCRLRAFQALRRKTIPAIVRRESSQKDLALDLAIENAVRKDFSPAEKAQAILTVLSTIKNVKGDLLRAYSLVTQHKLAEKRGIENVHNARGNCIGLNDEDIAECGRLLAMLGMSENTALKYLRLLGLPASIQDKVVAIHSNESLNKRMIEQGYITVTMGYEISRLADDASRVAVYERAIKYKWNAITLRAVIDELLQSGRVKQVNSLGSSKRRGETDMGLGSLTNRCLTLSSALWNFRMKVAILPLTLDKVIWRSGLKKLRKACIELVGRCDELLKDQKGFREIQQMSRNVEVRLTAPPRQRNGFRFSINSGVVRQLGLDLAQGDEIVFTIKSVKKPR